MLSELIAKVREYPGLRRKSAISDFVEILRPEKNPYELLLGIGDDSAVLRIAGNYLLFASDGIWAELHSDPYWAGYCSVLVNVNDIYAMGGVPIAMTNNVSYTSREEGKLLARGMKDGCEKFDVPMIGGHTHPDSDFLSISVSVIGKAEKVISSTSCREGDDLIVAVDLDGRKRGGFLNWDSTSVKPRDVVLGQLGCLVELAKKDMVTAGRDISNPGILGTIAMLLEVSRKGACLELDSIPAPPEVAFDDWMLMYPGFGFILTSDPGRSEEVIRLFQEKRVAAEVVGEITGDKRFVVSMGKDEGLLFDFHQDSITGLGGREE